MKNKILKLIEHLEKIHYLEALIVKLKKENVII